MDFAFPTLKGQQHKTRHENRRKCLLSITSSGLLATRLALLRLRLCLLGFGFVVELIILCGNCSAFLCSRLLGCGLRFGDLNLTLIVVVDFRGGLWLLASALLGNWLRRRGCSIRFFLILRLLSLPGLLRWRCIVVIVNLVVDLLNGWLNPKVRVS